MKHLTSEESTLASEQDCHLAMVLLALLSGGDYQPQGIANMGELRELVYALTDFRA